MVAAHEQGVSEAFSDALVQSFRSAQGAGTQQAAAMSSAFAVASSRAASTNLAAAAAAFAATAAQAVTHGLIDSFAASQARAFAASRQSNSVESYARAVASALQQGGRDTRQAYSKAMARAVAAGGDEAAGLAVATAVVFCEGGASAEAFSEALSQAIQQDPYTGAVQRNRAGMAPWGLQGCVLAWHAGVTHMVGRCTCGILGWQAIHEPAHASRGSSLSACRCFITPCCCRLHYSHGGQVVRVCALRAHRRIRNVRQFHYAGERSNSWPCFIWGRAARGDLPWNGYLACAATRVPPAHLAV